MVRENVIDRKKNVAIEELMFREDMKMFWTGGYRLVHALIDYYDLYSTLYGSDNLSTEFKRLHHINPMQFGMAGWTTYMEVNQLWSRGEYTKAGQEISNGLFPTHMKMEGNVEWAPLPYAPAYDGEELAGYVSGSIKSFTGIQNSDNLAACLTN